MHRGGDELTDGEFQRHVMAETRRQAWGTNGRMRRRRAIWRHFRRRNRNKGLDSNGHWRGYPIQPEVHLNWL
jgi:hypothetical protein